MVWVWVLAAVMAAVMAAFMAAVVAAGVAAVLGSGFGFRFGFWVRHLLCERGIPERHHGGDAHLEPLEHSRRKFRPALP